MRRGVRREITAPREMPPRQGGVEATVHTHYGSTDCGRTEHAGQEGWKLQYSDNFLRNMTDAERVMLIGTAPC